MRRRSTVLIFFDRGLFILRNEFIYTVKCLKYKHKLISNMKLHFIILMFMSLFNKSLAIWCYQCMSSTPGCSEPFNWRGVGYLGNPCPDNEDICVKLIERKGAQTVITRDCLSNFKSHRTDIPADTYEGCRPAARDVNLANYVNNTIKELDIKRDWYDEKIWCFCFLDHRCNGATSTLTTITVMVFSVFVSCLSKNNL